MRFSLPAVAAALIPIAQAPEIALESLVRISPIDLTLLGQVRVDAGGVATWHAAPGVTIPAGGYDLHLRADESLGGESGLPSVTLDVTLDGVVGASTAVAALAIPSYVADQSNTFPIGQAADFVGQGVGNSLRLVTAIDDINTSANLPANSVFSVLGSLPAENFVQLGYKRSVNGPYSTPAYVPIADRYNPSAAVKKGRSEQSSLELAMVNISSMGGLTRYNGQQVAVVVDIIKDNVVTTERIVYTGYGVAATVPRGDGNDEVVETSTGPFKSYLNFVAP